MTKIDIKKIQDIVIAITREELVPRFTKVKREVKADGSFLTEADLVMQQRLAGELIKQWPDTVFLGEDRSCSLPIECLGLF